MTEPVRKMVNGKEVLLTEDEKGDFNVLWGNKRNYRDQNRYALKRAQEYPPITEQLDAIWKLIDKEGIKCEMLDKIKKVKKDNPK